MTAQQIEDLIRRLRGVYVIPVNDGAGLLNGKDTFTRQFEVSAIQKEAADALDALRTELAQAQPYLKDGETVAQCIERNRKDIDATLTLLADARLQLDCERGVLVMTVARLGGIVEGRPTHRNNFLQRVDALREAEADLAALKSAYDELKRAVDPKDVIVGRHGIAAFASELYQSHLALTALKVRLTAENIAALMREFERESSEAWSSEIVTPTGGG